MRRIVRGWQLSPAKVHQIWQAAGLAPHRVRHFKLSSDPAFAAKVEDVVADRNRPQKHVVLYVAPPNHAIVLSLDEKSQIHLAGSGGAAERGSARHRGDQ